MSRKYKYADIKIKGHESEIIEFLRFMGAVQYLGNIGASRDLTLSVDGDGSGRLNFEILYGDQTEYKELPSTKIDTGSDEENFKFWLGE